MTRNRKQGALAGFTLVELMVVVAIMGVLSAIAIPAFVRLAQSRDRSAGEAAAQADLDQRSLRAEEQRPAAAPPREGLPYYKSADLDIGLSAVQRRYGSTVYTRTTARWQGRFVVADRGEPATRLDFPFPLGTTEARDVFLYFLTPEGRVEAPETVYDRSGIHWAGRLPAGETRLEAGFTASGGDRFVYRLVPALRVGALRVRLDASKVPAFSIPDHALQPTQAAGSALTWEAGNLVSDRPIIVDIPEEGSPLSRVFLLFRLIGAAVLLFGGGFWYVCELYSPGRTKTFRWTDFLPLALTYSLFFLNFGVLGLKGGLPVPWALAVAAALSLPLLALHVARIVDWNFALTRAVPLGAFTLGIMVNAVYGGDAKEYVFLGCALACVGYLTATWPVARAPRAAAGLS